jgi:thioredoxin-dependent peroxiredoxin
MPPLFVTAAQATACCQEDRMLTRNAPLPLLLLWLASLLACHAPASHAAAPALGTPAPEFKLQDQAGKWHELKSYRGKWVVLYF